MINELYQLINVLEKMNSQLNTEMVATTEVLEKKDAIVRLQNNQKLLMPIIQKMDDQHADIEKILSNLYECLENIVQDLDSIHELIVFAAQRHVAYKDKMEGTER